MSDMQNPVPAERGELLIQADGLVKTYYGRCVVNHVSLNVHAGEVVGLLGPNGAGKTTSFYMVMGLIRPDDGKLHFKGYDITHVPMYLRARMGMGYLAQEPSIFRKLTVEQNIMAILETLAITRQERKDRCEQLLEDLGLTHLAKQKAMTLSGGEPAEQAQACAELAHRAHQKGLNVWTYTGSTLEKLQQRAEEDEGIARLLSETDVLVDGPFILAQRSLELDFCGSRNQRLIDMNQTRKQGKIVLWTPPEW